MSQIKFCSFNLGGTFGATPQENNKMSDFVSSNLQTSSISKAFKW